MKKIIKALKQQKRNGYNWYTDQKLTDDLEREMIKAYAYYGMR
jgi:hypothetical protein